MGQTTEKVPFSVLPKDIQQKIVLHWWKGTFRIDHPQEYQKMKREIELCLIKTNDFNPQEIIDRHVQPFLVHSNELFSWSGNSTRFGAVSPKNNHRSIVVQSYRR
jgi:hypothetical protein